MMAQFLPDNHATLQSGRQQAMDRSGTLISIKRADNACACVLHVTQQSRWFVSVRTIVRSYFTSKAIFKN